MNTNIYSYLETSVGQSSNLYFNGVHFWTPVLIRHLWQFKTIVFLHRCLMRTVRFGPFISYQENEVLWMQPKGLNLVTDKGREHNMSKCHSYSSCYFIILGGNQLSENIVARKDLLSWMKRGYLENYLIITTIYNLHKLQIIYKKVSK